MLWTVCLLAVSASLLLARAAGGLRRTLPVPAPVGSAGSGVYLVARTGNPWLPAARVWPVEQTAAYETYSNGLRIDNHYATANHPRSYVAFAAGAEPFEDGREAAGPRRTDPAGIVFHSTESLQIPFEPGENSRLQRVGESVLEFVARRRAYHFLIDRFGRVYRIVRETDAANHAGNSVWADDRWVYVNLNESFLGVSLEAHSRAVGAPEAAVNPAQVRAAGMLTEMLRSRYGIAAHNCVTHAQVSVNPNGMLLGFHTDWAAGFPFEQAGLPNNYTLPLPAITRFGFHADAGFEKVAGMPLARGVATGEQALRRTSGRLHMSLAALRQELEIRYREERETVRHLAQDGDLEGAAAE